MSVKYTCDNCGVGFTVPHGKTARYAVSGPDLCNRCGENFQRADFADRRTLEQKRADRERTERLDRSYR